MNKGHKVISILSLFALASITIWVTTVLLVRGQSRQNTRVQLPKPYAEVEEKASAVTGANEKAIRELADAVLLLTIGDGVPTVLVSPYKEQVIRAEIDYRSGRKEGIPEANIVRVIEELALKLDAPDYARTDEGEVHDTRLAISYMMPHFIVHQPVAVGERSSTVPYTVNSTMSPLEAVYVTRFLIMQKETNESSLITPAERGDMKAMIMQLADKGILLTWRERGAVMAALIDQKLHAEKQQQTAEELAALVQHTADRTNDRATVFLSSGPSSARYKEMQDVFRRAYTMKISDALALANRSLELLGIEE